MYSVLVISDLSRLWFLSCKGRTPCYRNVPKQIRTCETIASGSSVIYSPTLPASAGIIWISQVLDDPLNTCHGLRTPPTLHNLIINSCFTWTSRTLQLSSIGRNFIFGAMPALQGYGNPYGLCHSLCTLHLVCSLINIKFLSLFISEKS